MHVKNFFAIGAAILVTVVYVGRPANAQFVVPGAQQSAPMPGAIHGTGQHELKLAPQKLLVSLTIRAEGGDPKSAIEAFVKHKDRVKKELLEMKAEESSIEIGAPQLSGGVPGMSEDPSSYQMRMIMQAQRGGAKTEPADMPKVYTAVSHVKAEWPLPTTDPDALALLPETLKEQITARDLLGLKNKAKLEKAQQEKLEELQTQMQENGGYSTGEAGQPYTVVFTAKVDDEARKKAIKAAYDVAVSQAETLAAVTGHKLGDLVSLRFDETPSTPTDDPTSAYAMAAAYQQGFRSVDLQSAVPLSGSPAGLKLNVKVDVEFAIAK